jgi:hypothetical protein
LHLCVSVCLRVSLFVAVFMCVCIYIIYICMYMQAGRTALELAKDDATIEALKAAAWTLDPEERAVIAQIKAAAAAAELDVKDQFDLDKFDADKLIMGHPPDAGLGVANFLNHSQGQEGLFSEMGKGLPALEEELKKKGTAQEIECADYVLNKEAGSDPPNITFQNGWRRDCDPFTGKVLESRQVDDPSAPGGKRGMRFADFMLHEIVIMCQLSEAEVFALRFYTTAGFKGINGQEFLKILCSEFYVPNTLGH